MVICHRCQINIAQFECQICNGLYCSDCDKFIHSNKPKINHKRNPIQLYEQTMDIQKISFKENPLKSASQVLNDNNLLNSNSNWNNNSLYEANTENNKSITIPQKETEQKQEFKLLSETYQPPSNNIPIIQKEKFSKTQMDINLKESEKTDNLKNPTHIQNLNDCISSNNYISKNKYSLIINEKDEEIKRLQQAIEEQREIINKLKADNNNLEELIEIENKEKENLINEKERQYNRKRKIEDFYSEKQREIQKIHDMEKYKLIDEFETQIREIGENFISKKTDYIRGIQEVEEKRREYEKNREEEKQYMFSEIDRLKNEGINSDKEQEYLIRSNDELNNKLRETTSNMDLLRATALVRTVPKMKNLLKNKKKKKGY